MKVNFEIEKNYAIEANQRHIDLHNNFDFLGFIYDNKEKSLILNWSKVEGDWIKADELSKLSLLHKSVSYFNFQKDEESYGIDDLCLSNLTYFPSNVRNMNDSVGDQRLPTADDDILYLFENGWFIRVKCEEIELIAKD